MDENLTSQQYIADIETFKAWNIDALKVDGALGIELENSGGGGREIFFVILSSPHSIQPFSQPPQPKGCYQSPSIMNITYPALSKAINASGHPMWLSCSWPCYVGGCGGGMAKVGAAVYSELQQYCNTWRDFNDIYDNIESLYDIIGAYTDPRAIALHNGVNRPGSWSDADMLTAGAGGLSLVEETMQMVMWAMFSSPLVMSNDLPNIPGESKALLLNEELIAVNQDVSLPGTFNVTGDHTYCKNLRDGKIALAGLHQTSLGPPTPIILSPGPTATSSQWADCLLPIHQGVQAWAFRDVLHRQDLANGTSVACMAAQPGVCLVVATPLGP